MARTSVYVLPHAGGAAYAYKPLLEALTPEIEVHCLELPGHGRHLSISCLPSQEFWKKLSDYGGVPAEVLASSELREYFEEILRRDFRAVETYTPAADRLKVPITVFFGQDDMSRNEAESWQAVTSAGCRTCIFPGPHFFLFNAIEHISRIVRQTLRKEKTRCCDETE